MSLPDWNTSSVLFLALLLAGHLLESLALVLDSRHLRRPLPALLATRVDGETWHKTRAYTQARHRLALWESTFNLLFLITFWFMGGFGWLDRWVTAWQMDQIATGVVYIGLLLLGSYGLNLPWTLQATFGLEARFGFNRTTWRTFVGDQIKGVLLAVLLGGPLLAGLLAILEQAGSLAWLYGWLATTLFALIMQWVVPRWILPLFNRFTPLADGEVRRAILAYAQSIHFPVAHIFEMDGSRRSSKANAFVTGLGGNRRIALFDTLIRQHTVPELVAILAHEIGHARLRHLHKMLFLGVLHTGLLFLLLSVLLAWPGLYQGFFVEGMPIHAGLVCFGMVIGPIDLLVGLGFKKLSRRFEYEADRFAAETAPDPAALTTALYTLARENLANLMPHPFYVMLHYSHPPLLERVAALADRGTGFDKPHPSTGAGA
ncbi:MAG: M48 family metallopeptidase [Magnetococcus sp. DMHC-8]